MKKLLVILLAGLIALTAAACGDNDTESKDDSAPAQENSVAVENSDPVETPAVADPFEVLTAIWNSYGEDNTFSIMGGDFTEENMVDGAPGRHNLDPDVIVYRFLIPAESLDKVDSAASFVHGMNANTFTCAAYHVKNVADVADLAKGIRDAIQGNHWMCGFPDNLIIARIDECLVSVFGNEELVAYFKGQLSAVYPSVELLYDEPID